MADDIWVVVLHDGVPLGAIGKLDDLEKWVVGLKVFTRPVKVKVEPHHRLMAVNGNGCRLFAQVGTCVLGGRRRGIVQYMGVHGGKRIALVPETYVLPLKEVARSHPR